MKSSPIAKWIVDAALLLGYCVAIWLDLTGLALHQWLGVGVSLLAGYHLLTHQDWVVAVTRRFFSKTSPRARIYYLINALILSGFITIGVTGLLISTWLNLTLDSMTALVNIHKWTAYLTLVVIFVKLALHWRWIVNVAGKFFAAPTTHRAKTGFPATTPMTSSTTSGSTAPNMATRNYTRREILKLMGAAALSTVAVVGVTTKSLDTLQALNNGSTGTASGLATNTTPSATPTPINSTLPTTTPLSSIPTAIAAPPTATSNTSSASTSSSVPSLACLSCRRGKHCTYPGDCRDYVDSNGNNRCDRGECA